MTSGVYRIRNKKTGAAYVGGSLNIEKRWSWHLTMLRRGLHTSPELQKLWTQCGEKAFVFEILKKVRGKKLRCIEDKIALVEKRLLNARTNVGYKHTERAKQNMRSGRVRFLKDPVARQSLSERAKKQHVDGKFGRKTWKGPARYNPKSAIAGTKALRAHIAQQSSAEMSRRAKLRKRVYNRWTGGYVMIGGGKS